VRAWVARHPILAFFVLAYAGCWIVWVPLVLSRQGLGILAFDVGLPAPLFLVVSTITGPTLSALVVESATGGRAGLSALWRRVRRVWVNPLWYLLAVFGPPLLLIAGACTWLGLDPASALVQRWMLLVVPFLPATALGLVVTVFEETGWMGVGFPRLQAAFGPLAACAVLGPLWATWHLPSFFVAGSGGGAVTGLDFPRIGLQIAVLSLVAIAIRICAAWIFNRTAGAVPLLMIGHSALDQAPDVLKTLAVPRLGGDALDYIFYGSVGAAALIVLVLTHGRLGQPQAATARAPATATT
jgi:membrane protease YdiL (CAAX protease family)